MHRSSFASLDARARFALICLSVVGAAYAFAAVSSLLQLNLIKELEQGLFVSDERIEANDLREFGATLFFLLTFVVSVVAWCRWKSLAYRSIEALGHPPKHGHRWAAGSYFVPFVNLYRPFAIMKELWMSGEETDADPFTPAPAIMVTWWIVWLGHNMLDQVIFRMQDAETLEALTLVTRLDLVSNLIGVGSTFLAISVVHGVSQRMLTRWRQLDEGVAA